MRKQIVQVSSTNRQGILAKNVKLYEWCICALYNDDELLLWPQQWIYGHLDLF